MTATKLAPPGSLPSREAHAKTVRCAIYTRKSTDEGLHQEFSSLDAQRESAEAFILSQRSAGWVALPAHYDDGGFSGANIDRPAFARLMADIEAGQVDCVVVYKVDRLSRSLFDFARIIDAFDRHGVTFVSVTQQFNTTSSIGRLTLNIILSFAQFEREIISERTRDKVAAARRNGKWTGGIPVLGYDINSALHRLVVNSEEAAQVRALFSMYLNTQSLPAVATEANHRGWTTKSWTKRDGAIRHGKPFDKANLRRLLTNVLYAGKVSLHGQTYPGEQEAIVDETVFHRVGELLSANGVGGGRRVRNRHGALLKGLLRCNHCDSAMVPSHTKKGNRLYRYYVCSRAQKQGWQSCPCPSLPAQDVEALVVDCLRSIGKDPELVKETLTQVAQAIVAGKRELAALETQQVDERELANALSLFDPVWDVLYPRERERIIRLLVERVDYDGEQGRWPSPFGRRASSPWPRRRRAMSDATLPADGFRVEFRVYLGTGRSGHRTLTRTQPPKSEVEPGNVPRISRLVALAHHLDGLLRNGTVRNYADIARLSHLTRARVTQIMNLLLLAPDIQEQILFLPRTTRGRDPVCERNIRPIAAQPLWSEQRRLCSQILESDPHLTPTLQPQRHTPC